MKKTILISGLFASLSCSIQAATLFSGGPIITMDGNKAEAVVINDGKIQLAGSLSSAQNWCKQTQCTRYDLKGHSLLPGFIDAHGHYSITLDYLFYKNVASPPVGPVNTIDELVHELAETAARKNWILGAGYDDSLLAAQRHPTRWDLDRISKDQPVFIKHVSGHLGVCNSKCLEIAGITKDSKDPEGGHIQRDKKTGLPNGVIEEKALDFVYKKLPKPSKDEQLKKLAQLDQYYAQYGLTTIQDGAANPAGIDLLREADAKGLLSLDVIAYPYDNWTDLNLKQYQPGKTSADKHFRIAGVKMVLDGSPQGKTAWLSHPYHEPPANQDSNYRGYATQNDAEVKARLKSYYDKGWQVILHANGDAAAEQMLDTIAALKEQGSHQPDSVMIHAQTVRDDQLKRMPELGVIPSFFVAHTFYWGDWHRDSVLGETRAKRISPLQSASGIGIPYTIHNDTPIVPPDMPLLLWTATQRQTRSGKTLGKDQQASTYQALQAITINAAKQHREASSKGSITVGKLADLVILDRNPLDIPSHELKDLKVLETFKEGRSVYRR
ncbi:MAG: amidohydrolase [Cellvibrionaceae bacterium]|nr:amidohydrolase [Cellvibrionaceae bacterium]